MYLGIDVGGTKTLLAVFSESGEVMEEFRFLTPAKYADFLQELKKNLQTLQTKYRLTACCCALPGVIDRQRGLGISFGNLSWQNVPILQDLQHILTHAQVYIENDAKLAGLSEALLVGDNYKNVLYMTLGTGIGMAHIVDGEIDIDLSDKGGEGFVLEHDGQLMDWEDFASGKALVERYGQKAGEIDDPKIWSAYAATVAKGLEHFIAVCQPEVVMVGGGVAVYFDKFGKQLSAELNKLGNDMLKTPPVTQAKRPEEAVIYGCYDYIRRSLGEGGQDSGQVHQKLTGEK